MNNHSVGGNSDKVKYIGMDQYGNKYYEDFDAVRKIVSYHRPQSKKMG